VRSTLSLPLTAGRNRTRHLRPQRRRWSARSAFYKTFPIFVYFMFLLLTTGFFILYFCKLRLTRAFSHINALLWGHRSSEARHHAQQWVQVCTSGT
jgi:hypothetical protein